MDFKKLDLTIGDALRPQTDVARRAFAEAADGPMHRYINSPGLTGWGADKPLLHAQEAMHNHIEALGWKRPNYSGSGYGYDCYAFVDGGTTRAFDVVLRTLMNEQRRKLPKPVIIMPVPTYGFFVDLPRRYGLEVITIERDVHNNGALDIDKLKRIIRRCLKEGKTIMGYYDCSPQNPLGFIRSEKETKAVGRLMKALAIHYQETSYQGQPMYRAWIHDQPFPVIIDDQVYRGLQYNPRAKIPSFSQAKVMDGMTIEKQTLTLMGPSKSGLSGLRVGVVVGMGDWITEIKRTQKEQSYFPGYVTLAAVKHFFAPKGEAAEVQKRFMSKLNRDHRRHGLLMKALINGMDTMDELRSADQAWLIKAVRRHRRCDEAAARAELTGGIRGLNIVTTPAAGFFHVLDMSEANRYKAWDTDKHYHHYSEAEKDELLRKPEDRMRVWISKLLEDDFKVSMVPLGWAGSKSEDVEGVRITYAIPRADIFEFADRARAASARYYAISSRKSWAVVKNRLSFRPAA